MNEKFQAQLIDARRKQILDAAIELIAEQGFARTTIKQIARRAGVADGTIYNYFKNKEDILLAVVGLITEAEVRKLHFTQAREMDFSTFVSEYVSHRMAEVGERFLITKALTVEIMVNPSLGDAVGEQIFEPSFGVAEAYLSQLMAEGKLEGGDPIIAARLFASPLLGLLFLRMLGDEHVERHWDAYAEAMSRLLLRGYGQEPNSRNTDDAKDG